MTKKIATLLLCLVMIATVLFGCGSNTEPTSTTSTAPTGSVSIDDNSTNSGDAGKKSFKVGYSNAYVGNTWRTQFIQDIEERFEMYKEQGIVSEYQVANTDNDVTEQMNQINSMINNGFDAIVIDPVSATALSSVIDNAVAKGIVVIIDNDAAAYEGTYCVAQDIKNLLTIATKYEAIKLGGEGDIVYISGLAGNSSDTLRTNAANAVLSEYQDIKMLATAPGNWSQTEAQSVMSTFLNTYGDQIDAVLNQDIMSEGILQAYSNAGIEPKLITGDCTKSFLQVWQDYENLDAICVPSVTNVGAWGVDIAVQILQGKEVDESILKPNPTDESMVNYIEIPVPYIIVKEAELENEEFVSFMETNFPTTKIMTDKEALTELADMPDTHTLGFSLSEDDLSAIFK